MKKFVSFVSFFCFYFVIMAQVPELMTYQAVLRDQNNHLVTNQRIGIQISILQDTPNGTAVYVERQTPTSNVHGLLSIEIGSGITIEGSLVNIQWGNSKHYIHTEIDLQGGSNYTIVSTSQLLTVPYAFHSQTADRLTNPIVETDPVFMSWNKDYNDLINLPIIPINVSQLNNDIGYLLSFTERDSIFINSIAYGITSADTNRWNHQLDNISFTERDSIFINSVAYGITSTDTSRWNHQLDNISSLETDPQFTAWGYDYNDLINVPTSTNPNLNSVLAEGNSAGNKRIVDLDNPINAKDAVNKEYVTLRVSYTNDTLYLGTTQWVLIPGISNAMFPPPIVTTAIISGLTPYGATSGGTVIAEGYSAVTSRGVCWNTSSVTPPTIANNRTTNGNGLGNFSSTLSGLTQNTTYYLRAYAVNSVSVGYGETISFTTPTPPPCTDGVTDVNENFYNGVEIGTQCWMKQNLRTTKYADGITIAYNTGDVMSTTTAYYTYPDGNSSNINTYGLLYNWKAIMRNSSSSATDPSYVQGICPDGWHVPSQAEFTKLINYIKTQNTWWCNNNSTYIDKALASQNNWTTSSGTCRVGDNLSNNNASGFSGEPSGYYYGVPVNFLVKTNFATATQYNDSYVYYRTLVNTGSSSFSQTNQYEDKQYGFSVRCVRDF